MSIRSRTMTLLVPDAGTVALASTVPGLEWSANHSSG